MRLIDSANAFVSADSKYRTNILCHVVDGSVDKNGMTILVNIPPVAL